MIVFTSIGLMWFWFLCYEIGYNLEPGFYAVRALIAVHLLGRDSARLIAMLSAYGVTGAPEAKENGNG